MERGADLRHVIRHHTYVLVGEQKKKYRPVLFYFFFFVWQVHVPGEVAVSGILPVYWCTAHYVEMLLKAEVPLVHSAFRMSGFTPSQVYRRA